MGLLTIRIPEALLSNIMEIQKDEESNRDTVVRKLLEKTVHEWKISKAVKMLLDGRWTVRHAAKFAGINYHEIMDQMTDHGIDSGPLLERVGGDSGKILTARFR